MFFLKFSVFPQLSLTFFEESVSVFEGIDDFCEIPDGFLEDLEFLLVFGGLCPKDLDH